MAPCGDWQQGAESAGSLLEGGGLIGHCGAPACCDVAVQVLTHLALGPFIRLCGLSGLGLPRSVSQHALCQVSPGRSPQAARMEAAQSAHERRVWVLPQLGLSEGAVGHHGQHAQDKRGLQNSSGPPNTPPLQH